MLVARKVEESDRELLNEAARSDSFHVAAGLTGEHWASGNTILYDDASGPVVALKLTNVARLDIQFLSQSHARNALALKQGFWPYIKLLANRGVEEVIFNSNSQPVIEFFQRRFGFRHLGGNTFSLRIK